MRQGEEQVMDKRSVAAMVAFLALNTILVLALTCSLDQARANAPLTEAVQHLLR